MLTIHIGDTDTSKVAIDSSVLVEASGKNLYCLLVSIKRDGYKLSHCS